MGGGDQIIQKGKIRTSVYILSETMCNKSQWNGKFEGLKENKCQPRRLYPLKVFFKNEGRIMTFFGQIKQ